MEAAQEAQKTLRELVAKSKAEGKVNDQEAWYGLVGGWDWGSGVRDAGRGRGVG